MRIYLAASTLLACGCSTSHHEAEAIHPRIHAGDRVVAEWVAPQADIILKTGSWQFVLQSAAAGATDAIDLQPTLNAPSTAARKECAR